MQPVRRHEGCHVDACAAQNHVVVAARSLQAHQQHAVVRLEQLSHE
jgi:hypothetical protein